MQTHKNVSKKTLLEMSVSMARMGDMFPSELPEDMKEALIKIEVLLEYGHIKSCYEEMAYWIYDTPKGSAYNDTADDLESDLYKKWTTWALFNREVLELVQYDNHVPQMKAFITRQLGDPETSFSNMNLLMTQLILNKEEHMIGDELMYPNMSQASIEALVKKRMSDVFEMAH